MMTNDQSVSQHSSNETCVCHVWHSGNIVCFVASVTDEEARDNFEKRHIGSLARLGLLPSFRFTGGRYSRSGRARLWPRQELYRSPRFRQMCV